MEKLLSDKICIVTGASRGIGAAIAARFRAEGAKVYALSRGAPQGATEDHWLACDVADEASIEKAIAAVLER
ncbi:MAG: hypothetical protein CVV53_07820, partial [Spirochaetae bacterium HGW-Spirochaetae-9]